MSINNSPNLQPQVSAHKEKKLEEQRDTSKVETSGIIASNQAQQSQLFVASSQEASTSSSNAGSSASGGASFSALG